jgi:2-methylcitrate dehydratase PrpD
VASTSAGVTRLLALHSVERSRGREQDDALRSAIVDTVGVAVAAAAEPVVDTVVRTLVGPARERSGGPATVWHDGSRASAPDAALINGTAGHALDYDDVWDPMRGHPSTVIVPALIAVAQAFPSRGDDILAAQAVALEVMSALARLIDVDAHYIRGWHATATLGRLGATAGVCRLLGLDATETGRALGIVSSMVSGVRVNFGTMVKPLHAGLAARDAVVASLLARDGLTASEVALEGRDGLLQALGVELTSERVEQLERDLAGPVGLATNIKSYPCCFNTHRAIDAALDLRSAIDDPDGIGTIEVQVEATGLAPLRTQPAATGLEAKFSMEHCVATALIDGPPRLASFIDAAVGRPQVRALEALFAISEGGTPLVGADRPGVGFADVRLLDHDGEVMAATRVDVPRGHAERPMRRDELNEKFDDCIRWARPEVDPAPLRTLWWTLGGGDPAVLGDGHEALIEGSSSGDRR